MENAVKMFFFLFGVALFLIGLVLLYVGKIFWAAGQLLRKAGGNIEPEKGLTAARIGILLGLAGAGIMYLTMTYWKD